MQLVKMCLGFSTSRRVVSIVLPSSNERRPLSESHFGHADAANLKRHVSILHRVMA